MKNDPTEPTARIEPTAFAASGDPGRSAQPDDLQRALDAVMAEPPLDDRRVEEAASRVWNRLQMEAAGDIRQDGAAVARQDGVGAAASDAFLGDIPAYLRGELSAARALLFEDHVRGCVACRRALQAARFAASTPSAQPTAGAIGSADSTGASGAAAIAAFRSRRPRRGAGLPAWLPIAALLIVGLGAGIAAYLTFGPWGAAKDAMARVETVDGGLYRIAGASSTPVATGAAIRQGEQVRTAKGSRAVLRMVDGSRIEMGERAGLALASARDGNTIQLERGLIIVRAAHQRPRHLYVATADCLVSVTGTIFAVNHGTKGSRVSVVDGEVRVQQSGVTQALSILHPGDQVTTNASVTAVPVRDEIAWSRDAASYDSMLAAVTAAGKAIDQQAAARPAQRTSSTLLDLVPAGSLVYVALPNLAANLAQTQQLLDQQLADNPVLQQWWSQTLGSPANAARFHQLVQQVADVGQYLGSEVVVAAGAVAGSGTTVSSSVGAPVMLAQATQEAQLRATLAQEIAAVNASAGHQAIVLLDQLPAAGTPAPAAGSAADPLLVWVGNGLMVASSSAAQIATVAANAGNAGNSANAQAAAANPFVSSAFHARLVQAYADGAGWLFAADLQQMLSAQHQAAGSGSGARFAESAGLYDIQDFVLEHHDAGSGAAASTQGAATPGTETRAALTFNQTRRGIASWLAAPAPMGSLGYFSSDANLVAAFVVKSPVELLDELLALSPSLAAELAKAEAAHGFNLRDDLAAPLGGEIALGLDGPLLPTPSWELVAEVYDPVHLQQTLTRLVQQANEQLVADGKPGMTLTSTTGGGNTYYTVLSSDPHIEIHYLFTGGYLLAAPTQPQLDRALAQRTAGTSLASSSKLRSLLGQDGQVNVSALFYQNMAPVLGALGPLPKNMAGAAGAGPGHGLGSFLLGAAHGPSLHYAYAEPDRIVFSGHSDSGPMGLNLDTLAGFGAILGGMSRSHDAATSSSSSSSTVAAPRAKRAAHGIPVAAVAIRKAAVVAALGRGPW